MTTPTIGPEAAAHVLWDFERTGGREPGGFTTHLIRAIAAADMVNKAKLAEVFPDYAGAVIAAQYDPDGIAHLQRIAAGLRCYRCQDTDGPFKGTGSDALCEGCIARSTTGGDA